MASNALANRRSVMNLFSAPGCPYCHRTRIVLAEKGITFETIDVDVNKLPEDLSELNPYNTVPTLVDRDLVLYDSRVIIEYLDERFPHPPLMPVDPVSRAKTRLALHRVEKKRLPSRARCCVKVLPLPLKFSLLCHISSVRSSALWMLPWRRSCGVCQYWE